MADSSDASARPGSGFRRLWSRSKADAASAGTGTAIATSIAAANQGASISAAELQALFARAEDPPALLGAFADGVAGLTGELRGMGQRLQSAQRSADWQDYGRALRHLIDKYIRTIQDEPLPGGRSQSEAERLRDLLHHALVSGLEVLLHEDHALALKSHRMADHLRLWQSGQTLEPLDAQLKDLCHAISLRTHEVHDAQVLLRSLFDLLLENVGELLEDGSWLQDQIAAARNLLAGPLDRDALEQTRTGLREVIYKQGLLKQGINESKTAMREMMVTFVDRLDGMANSTGELHDRISYHSQAIRESRTIADLGKRLEDILEDTALLQAQTLRARNDLLTAREEAHAAEQKVADLEQELRTVSNLVRVDQLTEALNRRGFDELFKRESGRAHRGQLPLCVALLDLDDFRTINARHGHLGGDAALCHVVAVIKGGLRGSDAIARFGGEEFVLLLPEAPIDEALHTVERLQQRLAQRPFMYDDARVSVSFSAGIARWLPGEPLDTLLERADRAMYQAKEAGKRRVVLAQ
jgi:diguanylate cyclase (GGDEF)-like protein